MRLDQRLAPLDPPVGPCDWGECDNDATTWRWDDAHGWLPVCDGHTDAEAYILVLRAHGRREHVEHPRLDCPACRKFAGAR